MPDACCGLCVDVARAVLNDSYRTDLCLLYPPQPIALACMHVASVLAQHSLKPWLQSLSCDLDEVCPLLNVALLDAEASC